MQTGITSHLSVASNRSILCAAFMLHYDLDIRQLYVIHCVFRGYNMVLCGGTGCGQSFLFNGLAHLANNKIIICILPQEDSRKGLGMPLVLFLLRSLLTNFLKKCTRLVQWVSEIAYTCVTIRSHLSDTLESSFFLPRSWYKHRFFALLLIYTDLNA